MRIAARRLECLTEPEIRAIVDYALRILDQVGMEIEHPVMCKHLAEHGADWGGRSRVHFPRRLMEDYLEREKRPPQPSPTAKVLPFEGTIGGYPLRWRDPADGKVKPHTVGSIIDMTRLADWLPNVTAIGSVGVPSDVPALLRPFRMRFIDWRYAERTLANSYVIWDTRL